MWIGWRMLLSGRRIWSVIAALPHPEVSIGPRRRNMSEIQNESALDSCRGNQLFSSQSSSEESISEISCQAILQHQESSSNQETEEKTSSEARLAVPASSSSCDPSSVLLLKSSSSSTYPCPDCDKAFPSPGKLRQHSYSHSGETPFECAEEACDKKFTSRFKLKRHILIHSSDKQFTCSVCGRPFRRKDHLKNHEKVHSACKTVYTCSHQGCTRNYNSYTSYRKHQAMHSAELGALDCKICHKELLNREALMNHLKVHYGSRSAKSSEEKKFPCNQCERRFFTRKDLKRHSVVHTGDREFPCPHCTQRFGRKDHMVRHAKKSHPLEYGVTQGHSATQSSSSSTTTTITGNNSSSVAPIKTEPCPPPVLIKTEPPEATASEFISPLGGSIKPEPLVFVGEGVSSGRELYSKLIGASPPQTLSTASSSSNPLLQPDDIVIPPKKSPKKSSNSPRYSPPNTVVAYSPVPSPGLAHILYNESSPEPDLDSFISQLVSDSGSDLPLLRPSSELSPPPKVKSLEEASNSSSSSLTSASASTSASLLPKKAGGPPHLGPVLPPAASAHLNSPPNGYIRLRNPSSDSVTHTKNPVLPSVYADNALIVPEPSKTKYPSSFQIDSEDSLSDLRALLPDQVFNQL